VAAFRQTFADQLPVGLPVAPPLAVEVGAMEESRLDVQTSRRRRRTARGPQPVGSSQHGFENFSLSGASAPRHGDGSLLGVPKLTAAHVQGLLDAVARARPHPRKVLRVDNPRAHPASELPVPAQVELLFQPPSAPELNPAERGWPVRKDELAWRCFPEVPALQARVVALVQAWAAARLQSLTAYPFIMAAMNALSP
jgi:hypothetical protein